MALSLDPCAHVLFRVPEGLEWVAHDDIYESLVGRLPADPKFVYERGSGRVHLQCTADRWTGVVEAIKTVPLLSVLSTVIVVAQKEMPRSVFDDAEKTCQFISDATETAPWRPLLSAVTSLQPEKSHSTFRATFEKGSLKHAVKSQELAGYVGHAFGTLYPEYKVNLTAYDYEVFATWIRGKELVRHSDIESPKEEEEDETILLLLGLQINAFGDPKYRNRKHFGRTSLNPCIAYCLARIANPKSGEVVLDMCCGTGTIPIEGASSFKDSLWIGSEVDPKTLCGKALDNVAHAGYKNVELMLGDGRYLCLRPNCIDAVVSDWPWGLREGSYKAIQRLYPRFMKELNRILKLHGKAYIVTQGSKLMNRVLEYPSIKPLWSVDGIQPICIGGHNVHLYTLSKTK